MQVKLQTESPTLKLARKKAKSMYARAASRKPAYTLENEMLYKNFCRKMDELNGSNFDEKSMVDRQLTWSENIANIRKNHPFILTDKVETLGEAMLKGFEEEADVAAELLRPSEATMELIEDTEDLVRDCENQDLNLKERMNLINQKLSEEGFNVEDRKEVFKTYVKPLYKSEGYYYQCLPTELKRSYVFKSPAPEITALPVQSQLPEDLQKTVVQTPFQEHNPNPSPNKLFKLSYKVLKNIRAGSTITVNLDLDKMAITGIDFQDSNNAAEVA